MIKKRLIALLILKDGMVVQSEGFKHTHIIHRDPSIAVEHFNKWAIDELFVLDVTRDKEKRSKFIKSVERISIVCFVPLTVGGWVTSLDCIRELQLVGADKVSINSYAVTNPDFITIAAEKFGSQCIVVSIDAKRDGNDHIVYTDRGRHNTGIEVVAWATKVAELGAGEILLSSIDNDGKREGYDIELMKKVSQAVNIPTIAFGGVHTWKHFAEGIKHSCVDAIAAANIFHYVDNSAKKAKAFLREEQISVR